MLFMNRRGANRATIICVPILSGAAFNEICIFACVRIQSTEVKGESATEMRLA